MKIRTDLATVFLALAACMSAASPVSAQLPPAPSDPDAIARLDAKAQSLHLEAEELYARGLRCRAGVSDVKKNRNEAFECFRKAAELGHAEAQYELSRCYLNGYGVDENEDLHREWEKKAADNGSVEAQASLAMQGEISMLSPAQKGDIFRQFQRGLNIYGERDFYMWLLAAAEQGHCRSMDEIDEKEMDEVRDDEERKALFKRITRLHRVYDEGKTLPLADEPTQPMLEVVSRPVARAPQEAETLYRKGLLCKAGIVVEKNDREAFASFHRAAELGHAGAQFELSECYLLGCGVAQSDDHHRLWLKKAAESGNAEAEAITGLLTADETEAVKWLVSAALKGCAMAQYQIGLHYKQGRGVPCDAVEGAKWLLAAAEQGYAGALCYLEPVPGNDPLNVRIAKQLRKDAEKGNMHAQYRLGQCYAKGEGVPQSYAEALKWYHAAEEYAAIAECYAKGQGVPQNHAKALEWYLKAVSDQGNLSALCKAVRYYLDGVGVPRNKAKAIELLKSGFDIRSFNIEFNQLVEELEDELDSD